MIGLSGATIALVMVWMGRLTLRFVGALALLGTACDLSSKPDRNDGGLRADEPPTVGPLLTLGPPGGVLAITAESSALRGASLIVPPEALTRRTDLSLEATD